MGRSAPNLALAILIRPGDEQANLLLTAISSALGVHDRPAVQEVSVSRGPYCAGRVRSFPSTWSGRGRMAGWLKRKQDAGEDIEQYRLAD